jgi:hypothetical protein
LSYFVTTYFVASFELWVSIYIMFYGKSVG